MTASAESDSPGECGELGRDIEGKGREREGQRGGLAGSMPRDWNWSTF